MARDKDLLHHLVEERWRADHEVGAVQDNRLAMKVRTQGLDERLGLIA